MRKEAKTDTVILRYPPTYLLTKRLCGGFLMRDTTIYEDIARRTGGDIYIGVAGPVRCGKSTFIKRFMEAAVVPNITDENVRARTVDELPQSAGGKTVMTTEPKFIPEQSVEVDIGNAHLKVKMVDCVGYMINGALGGEEDGSVRMVYTPWDEGPVPFESAAEKGTEKVIKEHSTVGIVVTTDASFGDLPRDAFIPAEERVISEMKEMGKPFVIVLNSATPDSEASEALAVSLEKKYSAPVALVNCTELDRTDVEQIIGMLTFEFPITEMTFELPDWIGGLPLEHRLREELIERVREVCLECGKLYDAAYLEGKGSEGDGVRVGFSTKEVDLGEGKAYIALGLDEDLFYKVINELSGFEINDKGELLKKLCELSGVLKEYLRFKNAIDEVERTGYGIVMPDVRDLELEKPEIVKQQGSWGVRLHAGAPSVHLIKTNIETEINPIVGTEQQSEDLVRYLLSEFENDPDSIWESNIFGKTLYELVNEGLHNKLANMPADARLKIGDTLSKLINEGCGGLICIIL